MTGRTFTVGTGSGNLTINGATLGDGLLANDVVEIAPGTYNVITIQHISITSGRVTIRSQSSRISVAEIIQNNIVGAIIENIDIRGGTQFNILFNGNNRPYRNITYRQL